MSGRCPMLATGLLACACMVDVADGSGFGPVPPSLGPAAETGASPGQTGEASVGEESSSGTAADAGTPADEGVDSGLQEDGGLGPATDSTGDAGDSGDASDPDDDPATDGVDPDPTDDDADADSIPDVDDPFPDDANAPGTTTPGSIYMATAQDLFAFDPTTEIVTVLGAFSGVTAVEDLAIDRHGVLYAIADAALFACDPSDAQCWFLDDLPAGQRALAFVPPGVLDPVDDTLLAIDETGDVLRIGLDGSTVSPEDGGQLGLGYGTAHDVVYIPGEGTFAAVTSTGLSGQLLVKIDASLGLVLLDFPAIGLTAQPRGLATASGQLVVFDGTGTILEVDPSSAASTLLAAIVPPWVGAASRSEP